MEGTGTSLVSPGVINLPLRYAISHEAPGELSVQTTVLINALP